MTTAIPRIEPARSLADIWERLGRVPLERIRWQPFPGTASERDVLESDQHGPLCELIDGVLVEKPVGFRESILAVFLARMLEEFADQTNLGIVTTADGMMRLVSGNIRIPDVAFIAWDRLPNRRLPDVQVPTLAPDLAIEILSPSNTADEMRRKREEYFLSGCQRVWEVDPQTRIVDVYDDVDHSIRLNTTDTLDGSPVLPGFTLPLRSLFARLDRHG